MANGITREDVWLAADTVLRSDARPTIERVRQQLGRGSPNTVGPHLDAWFRELGQRLDGAPGAVPTADMPAAVARASTELWRLALVEGRERATAELAAARLQLDQAELALEDERAALAQDTARLQAREMDLHDTLSLLRQRLQAAEERNAGFEEERRADSAHLTQALSLQSDLRQAHEALAAELTAERVAHAAERERLRETARAQEKHWLLELDAARAAARRWQKKGEDDLKAAQATTDNLRQERDEARTLAATQAAALAQAQAQRDAAHEMARVRDQHTQALQTQLTQAREQAQLQAAAHTRREQDTSVQLQRQHRHMEKMQVELARMLEQLENKERELTALRRAVPAAGKHLRTRMPTGGD